MPVISISGVSISFSGPAVLDKINLHIDRGERVCIVGRNGSGKSTLLKLITGMYGVDEGSITFPEGGQAALLPQEVPSDLEGTVFEIIARGFGDKGNRLIASRSGQSVEDLDPEEEWRMEQRIESVAAELDLDPQSDASLLSGGLKRRALLGQTLATDPIALVLDEPTNHLDIDSILWLETYLKKGDKTLVFVTHDRAFLRNLATRMVEVDLGQLVSYRCDYDSYLVRRDERLATEEKNRQAFEKKLSQEEAWIRQGIQARRTRNQGRVKALTKLREERRNQRARAGTSAFTMQSAGLSGRKVITATNVACDYEGKRLLKSFSLDIFRGDRIGVIGPNGSGKTTLIQTLLGKLEPSEGSVEHGTKLEIAYFDQLRDQIDETKTPFDNIADGNEFVMIGNEKKHVISYLQEFLFTPDRARVSTKTLSGGERNRLLLAKLFARPANLLVMDEPTNDLDAETLELLEEHVSNFPGTLIIVSHDRAFLESTITFLIATDKDGNIHQFNGGYNDWTRQQNTQLSPQTTQNTQSSRQTWKQRTPKLTRKQRQELDELPGLIDDLEQQKAEIIKSLTDPELYRDGPARSKELEDEMADIDSKLTDALQRWEELETLLESLAQ